MQKFEKIKKKSSLLLISGILILFAGFIVMSCGTNPTLKVVSPFGGVWALNTNVCPGGAGKCTVAISSEAFNDRSIADKEVTMEALVNPITASTGTVLSRTDPSRGIKLSVAPSSTAGFVLPKFSIMRALVPTGTVEYTVTSTVNVALAAWTHIAGVLSNTAHTTHTASTDCTSTVMAETPHLDIYVNGSFAGCASSWGGAGDTATGPDFAHNPNSTNASTGNFVGIIDEARIWKTARSVSMLNDCLDEELGKTGTCNRNTDDLILYLRFNEGVGHTVNDYTGLGSGGAEYQDAALDFHEWDTGWSTDQPTLTSAD